jgi:hypothetical protein
MQHAIKLRIFRYGIAEVERAFSVPRTSPRNDKIGFRSKTRVHRWFSSLKINNQIAKMLLNSRWLLFTII